MSGKVYKVSGFSWAGDPSGAESTNTMRVYYSNDNVSYSCVTKLDSSSCIVSIYIAFY